MKIWPWLEPVTGRLQQPFERIDSGSTRNGLLLCVDQFTIRAFQIPIHWSCRIPFLLPLGSREPTIACLFWLFWDWHYFSKFHPSKVGKNMISTASKVYPPSIRTCLDGVKRGTASVTGSHRSSKSINQFNCSVTGRQYLQRLMAITSNHDKLLILPSIYQWSKTIHQSDYNKGSYNSCSRFLRRPKVPLQPWT